MDYGVRPPLNSFIGKMLWTYEIGIHQLTPNSFLHLLNYVTPCAAKNWEPSVNVFLRTHQLCKVTQGCKWGWYRLSNEPGKMTVYDKPNKARPWKSEFLYFQIMNFESFSDQEKHNAHSALNRVNTSPKFIGHVDPNGLPYLTEEEKEQMPYFGERDGSDIIPQEHWRVTGKNKKPKPEMLPRVWIPLHQWYRDPLFMEAFQLVGVNDGARGSLSSIRRYKLA